MCSIWTIEKFCNLLIVRLHMEMKLRSTGDAFQIIEKSLLQVTYLVVSAGWTPEQTRHAFQLVAIKEDRLK